MTEWKCGICGCINREHDEICFNCYTPSGNVSAPKKTSQKSNRGLIWLLIICIFLAAAALLSATGTFMIFGALFS